MSNIDNARAALQEADPGPHADKHAALYIGGVGQQLNAKIVDLIASLEKQVDKIIKSNEKLAESNDKHSRAMFWLTVVLAFFAGAQVFVAWFKG